MSADAKTSPTHPWLGVLALVVCATLWSLNGPLIKLLSQEHVPGVTIACYRSLLGGLVFVPFAWSRRQTLRRVHLSWPIASVATFTLMTVTFVIATTKTQAANAIILQYTSPIWVFLLAPVLLHEHPRRAEGLVLLVAMAGVGVIFFGNPSTDGLIVALVSGVGYGSLTVVLRGLRAVNPAVVTSLNALGSGLLLIIPVAIKGEFGLTPHAAGLMILMALVQFTLPYMLFSWALQHVEAHRAALLLLLETVLNPLWTYLIVGEAPPDATLLGGPLILLGVVGWLLLAWRRERGNVALAPP